MRRRPANPAVWVLMFLTLAACVTEPDTSLAPEAARLLATPVGTSAQEIADNQAAATAEIDRAAAQATWNSANATLSAAQTQEQNSANVIAAQIAAAAEIARAEAQATLDSARSTQSAALTQDAARQTQVQFNSQMTAEQQDRNRIAAGTQTAIANSIATQTRAAAATSQWYADQSRQRDEQRQGPIAFLWTWCLPIFIVLFAALCLWGFWRWLKIQQSRQRMAGEPVEKLEVPGVAVGNELMDKDPQQATQLLEAVTTLDARNVRTHLLLGNTYINLGQSSAAIEQYQAVLALEPKNANATTNLGAAYYQMGKLDQAVAQFQTALELTPDDAETHYLLGAAFIQQNKIQDAKAEFQTALQLKPNLAAGYIGLGNVQLLEQDLDGAIVSLTKATQLAPNAPEAFYALGKALAQKGDRVAAKQAFQRFLALNPPSNLRAEVEGILKQLGP